MNYNTGTPLHMEYDEDKLRELIARCEWRFAKSMPENPHDYIVKGKCALTDEEFEYFVRMQRKHGVEGPWSNHTEQFLHINGYKYWTPSGPEAKVNLIDRAEEGYRNDLRSKNDVHFVQDAMQEPSSSEQKQETFMTSQKSNASLEGKTIGQIAGHFFVPDYQRGYRWTRNQVRTLLDDIWESQNQQREGKYCLQPVVVRRRSEGQYELIDGQQRFTTILILLKYLKSNQIPLEISYTLDYETRNNTAQFLDNINQEEACGNIDFFHIYNAHETIKDWFEQTFPDKNSRTIECFKVFQYLFNHVIVIWYEVGQEEEPIALFTRLNIGRIQLTNAELIRALLLREGDNSAITNEISSLWDVIENQLRDNHDELWYVMTKRSPDHYPARIELLFDMMSGKQPTDKEEYTTFFWFEQQIKNRGIEEVGKDIERAFLQIKEWYADDVLYHKIGYLIASGTQTMSELLLAFKDKRKSEIMKELNEMIAESIRFNKETYSELDYEHNYHEISRLLLLFNVQSLINAKASRQRFPFSKYNTAEWSLEHIHAQHSQGLKTNKIRLEWVKLHLHSVKAVSKDGENTELIAQMENIIATEAELPQKQFEDLFGKVCGLLSADTDTEYIHTISNMALLTRVDNSALNNATFDAKREKIIEMDKEDAFIPYCTKMVFLKYYTQSDDAQVHFWSKADRDAYMKNIAETLKPYMALIGKTF